MLKMIGRLAKSVVKAGVPVAGKALEEAVKNTVPGGNVGMPGGADIVCEVLKTGRNRCRCRENDGDAISMIRDGYEEKVINPHQVGGIETYICDNGAAKGSRVAWVNTGSGLRFKVAIDRGMDIVDAFYNDCSLSWLSHNGQSAPRPDITEGVVWLNNFSGGLLTTCGLSHVGGPEAGAVGYAQI